MKPWSFYSPSNLVVWSVSRMPCGVLPAGLVCVSCPGPKDGWYKAGVESSSEKMALTYSISLTRSCWQGPPVLRCADCRRRTLWSWNKKEDALMDLRLLVLKEIWAMLPVAAKGSHLLTHRLSAFTCTIRSNFLSVLRFKAAGSKILKWAKSQRKFDGLHISSHQRTWDVSDNRGSDAPCGEWWYSPPPKKIRFYQ